MSEYSLQFQEYPDYLRADVAGEKDSYEISLAFWTEILTESNRLGKRKILIVEDIQETASLEEVFQLLSTIATLGYNEKMVAFVDLHLSQHNLNQFGEIIGVQFGLNGKLFRKVEMAAEWLLEQEDAEQDKT